MCWYFKQTCSRQSTLALLTQLISRVTFAKEHDIFSLKHTNIHENKTINTVFKNTGIYK